MIEAKLSDLNQSALLERALDASKRGESDRALAYLKESTSREDAPAVAHFLLGAEYAQIQMYDLAIPQMEFAVAMDLSLSIARLQLGLLLLTCGDSSKALKVLKPLEELDAQNPLAYFGNGLIHLLQDEFTETIQCLMRGIALNIENQALNRDMQKIIDRVKEHLFTDLDGERARTSSEHDDISHILLSAYTGRGPH
jgi:tetratricopeptide (TPR) repeat protein